MRESIDFGHMNISRLFRKLLIPTVLGMVFSAVFVITDGIFVGKGIGSDALAAVNITAPLFMITTGIGLMFGVGASVTASILLSQGKIKAANINITQALGISTLLILVMSALCLTSLEPIGRLLGSSERLLPDVMEYMKWYVPFLVFYLLLTAGMFFIRLDGSPNYAMLCNAVAAVTNVILDYIFIFRFGWGLMGAAFATSLGTSVGGVMTLLYLMYFSHNLRLRRIKISCKSLQLTCRNIGHMIKLGSSAFISEASIACMMFLGNYVFIRYLGEEGVAAFSIACYFFPIIFMIYNAIAQSGQPIISYNFGIRNQDRISRTVRLRIKTALTCGICFFIFTALFSRQIVALFIDESYAAYHIAVKRFTLFCLRIYLLRPEYGWHRLLPEHRKSTSGNDSDFVTRHCIYVGRVLFTSSVMGYKRHLAGCSLSRIINLAFYRRNLCQRALANTPMIYICIFNLKDGHYGGIYRKIPEKISHTRHRPTAVNRLYAGNTF